MTSHSLQKVDNTDSILAFSLKSRIMWEIVVESGKSAGRFLAFTVLKDE
jgi:hypothetical protein